LFNRNSVNKREIFPVFFAEFCAFFHLVKFSLASKLTDVFLINLYTSQSKMVVIGNSEMITKGLYADGYRDVTP